ncbi:MAG: isoprenylcysteine carboxylmethyltransferase family protein [Oscillospiraceae bacterium]|nr:isoprenylcysteine carboxylmethyltransferase family protein [Oscillospiraceae bacterium]
MKNNLMAAAAGKLLAGLLILMLILFLPAGSLQYANGWLFLGILFIPMLIMGIVLKLKNPELLQKRLNAKETESEQQSVVRISGIMFLAGFITAGLNYRFGWFMLPRWAVIAAAVLFLLSYAMYAEVLRENAYLSRTIEVQENQKVVDTGLYGIVRHPMYSATVLMFLAVPLVLGSLIALPVFCIYPAVIVKRIRNEEEVLERGLAGYAEYKQKVKYRLIPYVY